MKEMEQIRNSNSLKPVIKRHFWLYEIHNNFPKAMFYTNIKDQQF